MLVVGLAVTVALVLELRPVVGDQEKVASGLLEEAVRLMEPPEQMVALVGATLTVGAPTVTVTSLLIMLQSVFAVITYVVVVAGDTVTDDAAERAVLLPFWVHRYDDTLPG